jgi:glycine/D-amino acid oxidase-like deaminating enzyme
MSIKHAVWDVDPDQAQPPMPTLIERAKPLLDAVFDGQWSVKEYKTFVDTYAPTRVPVVARTVDGYITVITGTHGSGVRLAPALAKRAERHVMTALGERVIGRSNAK